MNKGSGQGLERALTELLVHLEQGGFESEAKGACDRVFGMIEAAEPGSLQPKEQATVKRLYLVALDTLARRKAEIGAEIERVREAQTLLKACSSSPSNLAGSDFDISG